MKFTLLNNDETLEISASLSDRVKIARIRKDHPEQPDYIHCQDAEYDYFDWYLGNTEFNWVNAAMTGDLTDAPMLGILDEDGEISHRWAFMGYETRSILGTLLGTGKVYLTGGPLA